MSREDTFNNDPVLVVINPEVDGRVRVPIVWGNDGETQIINANIKKYGVEQFTIPRAVYDGDARKVVTNRVGRMVYTYWENAGKPGEHIPTVANRMNAIHNSYSGARWFNKFILVDHDGRPVEPDKQERARLIRWVALAAIGHDVLFWNSDGSLNLTALTEAADLDKTPSKDEVYWALSMSPPIPPTKAKSDDMIKETVGPV